MTANPTEARGALRLRPVDVVLLDYDLGEHSAEDLVRSLRQSGFSGKILLVTAGLPDREALMMIRAGVSGIFHKQHAPEDLLRSIREVHDGKVLIDERYLRKLVEVATDPQGPTIRLTEREKQVLRQIIEGMGNKEIAGHLKISESAVKATLQTMFSKTGVRTRSQLVRIALENLHDEI
jgi:two-component system, NarL family, nitrate/nitrite response regulator NarL